MNANPSNAAFPSGTHGTHLGGLTKLELFAAMIFANGWSPALPAEVAAKAAVVGADALLAELAKESAQGGKSDG